jgi:hypothetical protein
MKFYSLTISLFLRRRRGKLVNELINERIKGFLFPPEPDLWLSILRTGLGLQVLLYALSSRGDWNELFASGGHALVNREVAEGVLSVGSALVPRLGWLISIGARLGLSESVVLWSAWACLLCAGCFLLFGLFSRTAAVVAWFVHLSAVKSEELLTYGMDNFTTIGLFYLMLCPLPDSRSLDAHLWRLRHKDERVSGFFRRVLQVHMCFIYFFGGLTKFMGAQWWNGTSIWRALTSPPYNLISPEVLVPWRFVLPLGGILVCFLETAYPFFIWPKKTRTIYLGCVIAMHVGIGLTMGLYLFSLIMITLNLAAFFPNILNGNDRSFSPSNSGP